MLIAGTTNSRIVAICKIYFSDTGGSAGVTCHLFSQTNGHNTSQAQNLSAEEA